jgi:hypothetical protein
MIDLGSDSKSLKWIAVSLLISAWVVWTVSKDMETEHARRQRIRSVRPRGASSANQQHNRETSAFKAPKADQSDSIGSNGTSAFDAFVGNESPDDSNPYGP